MPTNSPAAATQAAPGRAQAAGVRVRVPAKVNLHLSVGPRRPDGFHDLVTVFHAVDLHDEITATPSTGLSLAVTGEGAGELPTDDRNLAWRAAQLLADSAGRPADVHLDLHKRIPVAGGMAGGSADAAAALLACARLWGVDADLAAPAARLGSDVNFPLVGGTALGTGRGESIAPLPSHGALHWVFVLADFGIPAGAAYAELDRLRAAGRAPRPLGAPDELLSALADGDVHAVAHHLGNDLEPAATGLAPRLRDTLGAGRGAGALAAIVSGSGPTCALLCADAAAAHDVAATLAAAGHRVVTATGPAAGAAVIT